MQTAVYVRSNGVEVFRGWIGSGGRPRRTLESAARFVRGNTIWLVQPDEFRAKARNPVLVKRRKPKD